MRHRLLVLVCAVLFCAPPATAAEMILASVPGAAIVGRGVLSFAFWDVYTATLAAPDGRFDPAKPFALTLDYLISIKGRAIAERSIQEMRKQGFGDEARLADWNARMKAIFPDVHKGTILSAVYVPGKETKFFDGNREIGTIEGDDFAQRFFNIWLGEKTSEPKLRRALLGLS